MSTLHFAFCPDSEICLLVGARSPNHHKYGEEWTYTPHTKIKPALTQLGGEVFTLQKTRSRRRTLGDPSHHPPRGQGVYGTHAQVPVPPQLQELGLTDCKLIVWTWTFVAPLDGAVLTIKKIRPPE